jgi:predicted alpha-1,6-mannanase (GH76 family)
VLEGPVGALAPVWPVSQVLAAAIDVSRLTGDLTEVERIVRGLREYERGDAYVPLPGRRRRYYDDNAWVGLCFAQLHRHTGEDRWLRRARRAFGFVREGRAPDGGLRWVERRRSLHACSTAPAAQLALRLREAGGGPATTAFARGALGWMDRTLRLSSGLYADHVDRHGVDRTVWSYNQGSSTGAHWLLDRVDHDPVALANARRTARASLHHFDNDRLWRHPPVFNAIWLRNLMALDTLERVPGLDGYVDDYLDRIWREALDRGTGLFTAGGIGTYDGTPAIDHAGAVQLFSLLAWPRERRSEVC